MTKEYLQKIADDYREAFAKAIFLQDVLIKAGYSIVIPKDTDCAEDVFSISISKHLEDKL